MKVLDFGLAKLRDEPPAVHATKTTAAPLTGAGTFVGTLPYMAPEQLNLREADTRSDLFAFGAIVYEMAGGQRAFIGDSQASLIAAILDRDPAARQRPAMGRRASIGWSGSAWRRTRCPLAERERRCR